MKENITVDFKLPHADPPPWRDFKNSENNKVRATKYQASEQEIKLINAALLLRRPLLITGSPGVGKSSLAYAVAERLNLGNVLHWQITSKSMRQDGLYQYDALTRLQDATLREKFHSIGVETSVRKNENIEDDFFKEIGRYITLGPLGTAFLNSTKEKPSVVLIDELDKSDIDLPNDLLHLFEEGEFEIPEIARMPSTDRVKTIEVYAYKGREKLKVNNDGFIRCNAFPLVIITSNGEREFPPAFLRRCLRLRIPSPTENELRTIVEKHLNINIPLKEETDLSLNQKKSLQLLEDFLNRRDRENKTLATDQLLNAMYLFKSNIDVSEESLRNVIFESLSD